MKMPKLSCIALLMLAACGVSSEDDPIYLALKANPPTSIPPADLAKLRAGRIACNIFNDGEANEYQTCWWPAGKPLAVAQLHFYRPAIRGDIVPGSRQITYIEL